jgi:hypothetical protein
MMNQQVSLIDRSAWLAATKKPAKPAKGKPVSKPAPKPVKTQMMGEHGDDDLGYDPRIIPTETIPDD